jgi:predicted Fe-Mo cluster-binding NifX family protein
MERLEEIEVVRIAVPAGENKGLDSTVSPYLARCLYFVLVDFEERQVKTVHTVPNPHYGQQQPRRLPGFVHNHQVDVILTSGLKGRTAAFSRLCSIQAMSGASVTVRHALERYVGYRLGDAEPCRESVARE